MCFNHFLSYLFGWILLDQSGGSGDAAGALHGFLGHSSNSSHHRLTHLRNSRHSFTCDCGGWQEEKRGCVSAQPQQYLWELACRTTDKQDTLKQERDHSVSISAKFNSHEAIKPRGALVHISNLNMFMGVGFAYFCKKTTAVSRITASL